jgi:hypothetical protein
MAWVESHQALGHHPKTIRLAELLKVRVPEAVGLLHFLWWWALDYAPNGLVPAADKPTVAHACLWHRKPDDLWSALLTAGFVEEAGLDVLKIHDWMDYAGRLVEKRAANAERMRNARAKHVQRTSGARAGATVPDRTGPNRTEPDLPPGGPPDDEVHVQRTAQPNGRTTLQAACCSKFAATGSDHLSACASRPGP